MASNAPHDTLEKILKKNEIYELFDEVIGASKEIPQKPDPAMLHLAVSKTGADKAIFVGDSLKDELAAKKCKYAICTSLLGIWRGEQKCHV